MSGEIIFRNSFGKYKVGDKVYVITTSWGTPSIKKGVLTGYKDCAGYRGQPERKLRIAVEECSVDMHYENGDSYSYHDGEIEDYVYDEHDRIISAMCRTTERFLKQNWGAPRVAKPDRKLVWVYTPYIRNTTLNLNRILPRHD